MEQMNVVLALNQTLPYEFHWTTGKIIILPLTVLLVLLAIVGNGLVIISWILHSYLRTPSNALLVSLSVTDLLVAIFGISLTLQDQLLGSWKIGETMCFIWIFSNFGITFVSSMHLVLIAVDRYRILFHGVSYLQSRTIKSALRPVLYLWLFAVALMSPLYLDWNGTVHYGQHPKLPEGSLDCQSRRISSWRLLLILNFIGFPSVALVLLYYNIYKELKRRFRKSLASYNPGEDTAAINLSSKESGKDELASDSIVQDVMTRKTEVVAEKERKAAKTLGFLVVAFLVCWTPYFTVVIASVINPNISKSFFHFARIMGAINSGINPLIYAVSSGDFRRGFRQTLTKSWCR